MPSTTALCSVLLEAREVREVPEEAFEDRLGGRSQVLIPGLGLVLDIFLKEEFGHLRHFFKGFCALFKDEDDLQQPCRIRRHVPHPFYKRDEPPGDLAGGIAS